MKTAVIFLLTLCFFLIGGTKAAQSPEAHRSCSIHSVSHLDATSQQLNLLQDNSALPVFQKDLAYQKKAEVISSIEDEDDELISAKKQVLFVKYLIVVAYTSVLIHLFKNFKNRLPFCTHFSYTSSYKYLLQRVLRI